jgi:hypothetical protein
MSKLDDPELGMRILPGVDLTLWFGIIVAVLAALVIGGVALVVG